MKYNPLKEKSFVLALEIVNLYKKITIEQREFVMSKQLLRSGTSIGANVRESVFAESKADFIHKLAIALKEANETDYWIELLKMSGYISELEFENIKPKVTEQLKLLSSIITTTKKNY